MADLVPVDRLEVQILVDNVTDVLSSVPAYAESETTYLLRTGKMPVVASKCLCCAAHGFSCLVTAYRGTRKHAMLFDIGPESYAFIRNCQRLGIDLGEVEGILVSHGHIDHGGAVLAAIDAIRERNGGRSVPFYAHPDMFRSRGLKLPNGAVVPLEDIPGIDALTEHGAHVSQ